MNYESLTYQHRFASGLVANIVVHRKEGTKPRVFSDFNAKTASESECREYMKWRTIIVADMMSVLSPGEVLGCAEHGLDVARRVGK